MKKSMIEGMHALSKIGKTARHLFAALITLLLFGFSAAANAGATTTTLAVSSTAVQVGQAVVFTVTVTGGSPTGQIMIGINELSYFTGIPLVNGVASFSTTQLSSGTHSVKAYYNGDANNDESVSGAISMTVTPTHTVTLTLSPNAAMVGDNVNMTATVTGTSPSGTVTFKDGATTLCTGSLSSGQASCGTTSLAAGIHSITAVYAGDANNSAGTSAAVSLRVAHSTTTALAVSSTAVQVGQAVEFTMTVTGANPTGRVMVVVNETSVMPSVPLVNGAAVFSTTQMPAGTFSLKAYYGGDDGNDESTSAAVIVTVTGNTNTAPTVSITAPTNNATYTTPASITLSASATDSDGSITQVKFYDGATLLGTATQQGSSSTYTFNWNNVAEGSYTITAVATDNGTTTNTSTSSAIQFTVTARVAQVYYIHTDQLDTPRLITDSTNTKVWEWSNDDPFANNVPNDDPNSTGHHFEFNHRLPGQYADKETNTHYNYYRDYDPQTGRYIQSDPIGLEGGINTYGYVGGNPLSYSDPTGQIAIADDLVAGGIVVIGCALSSGCRDLIGNMASSASDAVGQGVDKVKDACTPDNKDPCDEIKKQIRDLKAQLANRENALANDQYDLYNRAYSTNPGGDLAGKGTYTGHVKYIDTLKIGLARKIAQAKAMGCI